jgi:hypothetical protein
MKTRVMIRPTGFSYSGEILFEDATKLIIQDVKVGRLEILKSEITLRGDF